MRPFDRLLKHGSHSVGLHQVSSFTGVRRPTDDHLDVATRGDIDLGQIREATAPP